jgi:hypothetical protein
VIGTSCHPERLRDGAGAGRSVSPGCGEITIGIQQILGSPEPGRSLPRFIISPRLEQRAHCRRSGMSRARTKALCRRSLMADRRGVAWTPLRAELALAAGVPAEAQPGVPCSGDYCGSTAGLILIRSGLQWPWFSGGWSTERAVRMTTRSRRAMSVCGRRCGHADSQRAVGPRAGVLEQVRRVGNDRQDNAGRRRGGQEVVPAVRVACQVPALVQSPVARREEHVVNARRGVVGQFQYRRAPLVAELPADGREQPLAQVTGVTDRQPAAVIGGIDRPHVPDLMTSISMTRTRSPRLTLIARPGWTGTTTCRRPLPSPARSAIHNLRHLPGPDSRLRSQPGKCSKPADTRHDVADADSDRARLPGTGPAPRLGASEDLPDEGLTREAGPGPRRPPWHDLSRDGERR